MEKLLFSNNISSWKKSHTEKLKSPGLEQKFCPYIKDVSLMHLQILKNLYSDVPSKYLLVFGT